MFEAVKQRRFRSPFPAFLIENPFHGIDEEIVGFIADFVIVDISAVIFTANVIIVGISAVIFLADFVIGYIFAVIFPADLVIADIFAIFFIVVIDTVVLGISHLHERGGGKMLSGQKH